MQGKQKALLYFQCVLGPAILNIVTSWDLRKRATKMCKFWDINVEIHSTLLVYIQTC